MYRWRRGRENGIRSRSSRGKRKERERGREKREKGRGKIWKQDGRPKALDCDHWEELNSAGSSSMDGSVAQ